jgi:hypothetical protein
VTQTIDQLRRELRRVKDKELDAELKAIHKELAREVTETALPNVPVLTGRMKATVRAAGTVRDAIGRVGGASTPYTPVQHWKYGPPFLTDAAKSIEADITERYDAKVADMLDRTIGR